MKRYKYFEDVLKNGFFTKNSCQFCGSNQNCLDGSFFDRDDNLISICLNCFDKRKINVDIPDYIAKRVRENRKQKVSELSFCPPVPWIQNNDWPVCCDDFMIYIGEWEQEDFCRLSDNGDGLSILKELLIEELKGNVENYEVLWDDLGYGTAAFAFKCVNCGKIVVICQDY